MIGILVFTTDPNPKKTAKCDFGDKEYLIRIIVGNQNDQLFMCVVGLKFS